MSATGNERIKPGRHRAALRRKASVERLEAALLKVAHLVERDPTYTPIFERLEAELARAKKIEDELTDAQKRARDLLARYSDRDRSKKTGGVL